MTESARFGSRRIYYNNVAEHLLNAYNPNMTYQDLPYRCRTTTSGPAST